jgi:hypothetical protein
MNGADTGDFAEVLGKPCQVAEVEGFDDEVDVDGLVVGGAGLDRFNVGPVFGDDGGELPKSTIMTSLTG